MEKFKLVFLLQTVRAVSPSFVVGSLPSSSVFKALPTRMAKALPTDSMVRTTSSAFCGEVA
jgi:hypothetical protein